MLVVAAIADSQTELAGRLLDRAQPESPDNTAAEVSSCMGMALGLLDDWLSGQHPDAPKNLVDDVRLPAGHLFGERAASSGRKRSVFGLPAEGSVLRAHSSTPTRATFSWHQTCGRTGGTRRPLSREGSEQRF